MSPKVPKAYLEARRTEILGAAVKCFTEKGFHNTTMQDIYTATNLSPGAVYNYFSSKEDIVVAAIEEFNDWTISSLDSLISENPEESLNNAIEFWMSLLREEEFGKGFSVQLDFYAEAMRDNRIREAVLESQNRTHDKLIENVRHYQQMGLINTKLDPLSIARAIMGMVFGIYIHKSLDPEVNLEAYTQVFKAMINGTFSGLPDKHRKTN